MSRYIPNLVELDVDQLQELHENGLKDIDTALGDEILCYLTIRQLHFIEKLIKSKNGVIE
mgnify:FL=1